MKYNGRFTLSLLLVFTILTLSACGGGGTSLSPSNGQSDHPKFSRSAVTDSPRYEPSGLITDVFPTFSWKAIPNATEYKFGHENTADETQWLSYTITASEATCNTGSETCKYRPTNFTFPLNVEKVWWLKAKVNGQWQDWSNPIVFTVNELTHIGDIPSPIMPSGSIANYGYPRYFWTCVDNATEYKVGYENSNTAGNWQTVTISISPYQTDQTCGGGKLNSSPFSDGDEITWWVKAKINGVWGDWSDGMSFTLGDSQIPVPYTPSTTINTSNPEFSWKGVEGATEYQISHEDTLTSENWDAETLSAEDANCSETKICKYTLSNTIFSDGDQKTWWVKAKVNDIWSEWSKGTSFIIQSGNIQPFVFKIQRKAVPTEFFIGTVGSGYNYDIDCDGDGIFESTGNTSSYLCKYRGDNPNLNPKITIQGTFPQFRLHNLRPQASLLKIEVEQWGSQKWRSMESAFEDIPKLEINATDSPDLSQVTNMSNMFKGVNWDNQNNIGSLRNWDVSNVTNMSNLFSSSTFIQDISNWDVSNVTDMSAMFSNTPFNQDISNWGTNNVTDMSNMFLKTPFNQNIGNWNVSNVTNMSKMFDTAKGFNKNISNWDVSNVTNLAGMFSNARSFDQNLGNWNVANATNMSGMFLRASLFNQDLSNWDVSNVILMSKILYGTSLSTDNYDLLLNSWSTLNLQTDIHFNAGETKYSSASEAARNKIITDFNWTIDDGGLQ